MADRFHKFIRDEISVMLRDLGHATQSDSKRVTQEAIAWIEKNASDFRLKWEREKKACVRRNTGALKKPYDVE